MIRRVLVIAAGLGALVPASGVLAAENMECMASGYSTSDQARLDQYVSKFTMAEFLNDGPPMDVSLILKDRAEGCAQENDWPDDARKQAGMNFTSVLAERGIRKASPETAIIVDKVDETLSQANQNRLWSIMTKLVGGNAMAQPSEADIVFLGVTVLALGGDGSEESSENIGSLLATIAIQRSTAEKFADA